MFVIVTEILGVHALIQTTIEVYSILLCKIPEPGWKDNPLSLCPVDKLVHKNQEEPKIKLDILFIYSLYFILISFLVL